MARENKGNGFSMDGIVETIIHTEKAEQNIKQSNVETPTTTKKKNSSILDAISDTEEKKVPNMLYLQPDVTNVLDYYGEKVGKPNGGKSKFVNEIITAYLKENNLWLEKVATKKRDKK